MTRIALIQLVKACKMINIIFQITYVGSTLRYQYIVSGKVSKQLFNFQAIVLNKTIQTQCCCQYAYALIFNTYDAPRDFFISQ